MAKISGKIYVVVGLAVILLSYLVNMTRDEKSFTLFMFIGGLFILIGIVKEVISSRKSSHAHETHLHHGTHNPSKKQLKAHHTRRPVQRELEYCRNCGTAVNHHDNFCPHCGNRVR